MGTRRRHPFPSSLFFNDVTEWWRRKGFQWWRFRRFYLTKAYLPSFNLKRVEVFTPRSELSVMMRNSNDLRCWVLRTTKDDDREEENRNVDRWREGMLQGSCVRCRGSWSTLELLSFSQKHTGLLFFWPNPQHYIGKVTETQNPTFKKNKRSSQNIFCWKITGETPS